MRIGIEAQRIFRGKKHGMDIVALETIKQLQCLDNENEYYIFVAPGDDKCLKETVNFHIVEIKEPTYPLWEQVGLLRVASKYNLDLLHCTSNTAPIYSKIPLVLTLHDIIFLEPSQGINKSLYQRCGRVYRRFVVPKILDKCKKIITVSNCEKDRICDYLKLPKDKFCAIYNGYNTYFKQLDSYSHVTRKYIEDDDYIFFLGNTDPKKNVPGTLKAYSYYLKMSKHKKKLLIADIDMKYLDSILKENDIEDIKSNIVSPGYVNNTDLAYIYNGASVFLYTSFRESFGIPLLEAMACGTPVITGNKSALPEIAGEGAVMVDVSRPEDIAGKLIELEENPRLYQEQVKYGLERVKMFSWHNTALQLKQIYESIGQWSINRIK